MRKSLLLLLWLVSAVAWATDVKVTPETFKAAYEAAEDGDVLLLAEGTYGTEIQFPSGKTITIKADEGAKPVFTANVRSNNADSSNGGLIFDGIDINHNTGDNYVINLDNIGDIAIIACRNCEIQNVGRCFLRTNNADATIGKIEFINCLIHDNGQNGWNFMYPKHAVQELTVENTSFYNYTSGESFLCLNGNNNSTVDLKATITNSMFYNWGKDANRAVLMLGSKSGTGSTYSLTNNIFGEDAGRVQPSVVNASNGALAANNNLLVNIGGYKVSNGTQEVNDITLESLGLTAIGFPDPANGDFTLMASSPLAKAGKDGKCVGDPRWIKTLSDAVKLTVTVNIAEAGTVAPQTAFIERGEMTTLTATANYGYAFTGWQKDGQIISTENPYEYTMEADADIIGMFEKLTMYTLTVNKDGDGGKWGTVYVSPEREGNLFEAGEKVRATIVVNPVTSFLKWEDGSADVTRSIEMDADKTITATFDVIPFIMAWDFNTGQRSSLVANYYYTTDNTGLLNLYNGDGSQTSWGHSVKTFGETTYECARRYTEAADLKTSPRYFTATFSAKGYTNVKISSKIGVDNECILAKQKLQYSTDGANFTDLAVIDVTDKVNADWSELGGTLPELTDEEKTLITLRWIPDTESDALSSSPSGTEGYYLANIVITGDEAIVNDTEAPVVVKTEPQADATGVSASGNIVFYFNEKIKAGEGSAILNGEILTATVGSKTLTFAYKALDYGKSYSITLPEGIITDLSGNDFAGTTLSFTVMERPQPKSRLYDVIVAADGSGDVKTIQEAVDKCPTANVEPWLIFVKNGIYNNIVRVPSNKPYIRLIGQDKEKTIITFKVHSATSDAETKYTPSSLQIDGDYVVKVDATDFYAENISFENAWGVEMQAGPMALAMKNTADRFTAYNCKFRSYQDTWYSNMSASNNRLYANKCFIEGAVDYFYGDGNAYIENSVFHNVRSGSVITAPSHKADTNWGFVFANDTLTGNKEACDGNLKLGRPWHNAPIAVWLNTTAICPIHADGWTEMGVIPKLFAEYNSMDKDGNPLDISHRKNTYTNRNTGETGTCQNVLTAEEAAKYTYENVVAGSDKWNPRALYEDVASPVNLVTDYSRLSWEASKYAICYVIYLNGEMIGQTIETNYALPSVANDIITVCAVNENGHQSAPATATFSTDISKVSVDNSASKDIYNLRGIKTNIGDTGIYVSRGKKVIVK